MSKKNKNRSVTKKKAFYVENSDREDASVHSFHSDVENLEIDENNKIIKEIKLDVSESVQEDDSTEQETDNTTLASSEAEPSFSNKETDNGLNENTAREDSENDLAMQTTKPNNIEPSNKTRADVGKLIPITMVLIIVLVLMFLLIGLPLIKKNNALGMIKNCKNEEAIAELTGVLPVFGINDLKKEAANSIIHEIAESIQKENPKFSSDHFAINSISNSSINISDDSEEINFVVNYSNNDASAVVTCRAEKSFNGSEWILNNCDIVSADYSVHKECDQSIPDEAVSARYPDAVFVEKTEKEQLHQSFVYEYRSIDEDNPFYYANNRIDILCTYNLAENKWVIAEVKQSIASTEEMPLKEFTTSIFTIKLPEAWIMRMYEDHYVNDYNGEHHESYSYTYQWFASKEDFFIYNDKDMGTELFSIGAFANDYITPYESSDNNYTVISSTSLGEGKLHDYSYNDITYYDASFKPQIMGLSFNFSVSSRFTDSERFINLLKQINLKTTKYNLEVLVKRLNIRPHASTYGDAVGTAAQGQTFVATEIIDSYDGYRWYKIDEDKWLADLNGEYLKVTYR